MFRAQSVLSSVLFVFLYVLPAAAQTTYYPAAGPWNGFFNQTVISECDNGNSRAVDLALHMVTSAGEDRGTVGVTVSAYGSAHTILNDLANISNNHGVYTLTLAPGQESLGDKLNCRTLFYRPAAAGAAKVFDYVYSLAVQNAQSGRLSGVYNSLDPAGGDNISYNWLSLVNFDTTPFTATVKVYAGGGALDYEVPVTNLAPGARQDIPLGHPKGQVTGLWVVNPQDNSKRYDATLIRYNAAVNGHLNFAFPLRGTSGSCTGNPVLASTMGNGWTKNWLEIANANDIGIAVTVEVRDRNGVMVHTEKPTVPPKGQYHVFLSDKIDPNHLGNVGSARVLCDDPTDKLIIQSTFYGSVPGSFPTEWAYSTQELGRLPVSSQAEITAPVNTYVGMANWFKFADSSLSNTGLAFTVFNQAGGTAAQGDQFLPGGGTSDLGVHAMVPADRIGSVRVSSATVGAAYSGEMLRVLSRNDGQIGNIVSIPGIVTQNGISDGSFRGNPQSLAQYRDRLSTLEADRLLTTTSFGGSPTQVSQVVTDGLDATVNRLTVFTPEPPALNAAAEDELDTQVPGGDNQVRHAGVRRWWLTYLYKSPNPLKERMAMFWHDRFASSCRGIGDGLEMKKCVDHVNLLRREALGNYRRLLKEMTVDYLMLTWLNGNKNVRQNPDENYAREIMELFSLGERSHYGRGLRYPLYEETKEIREFARSLTGYTTQFVNDQFGQQYVVTYVLDRHDTAPKTVWAGTPYEITGSFSPLDVPDVILNQRPRDVGRYLSGALFTSFCHDHPSEQLKAQMADILISSDWELWPLIRRILKSEACFSADAYKSRMLDPLTQALGFLKRTGIPMRVSRIQDNLPNMGFDITNPPDVFGWKIGYREAGNAETTFWNAFPVEYGNFITNALRNHESDFTTPDTRFDFCSLNPHSRARSDEVVDALAIRLGLALTPTERDTYIHYMDYEPNGTLPNGDPADRPNLYDARVASQCRTKIGGVLWLMSVNPRNLTY